MALVTYGSSDESDYSDDEESQVTKSASIGDKPSVTAKSLLSTLPPPKSSVPKIDTSGLGKSGLSLSSRNNGERTGSTTSTTTKPTRSLNLPPPKKNQPVKITVPSLPDPDSDEDEPVPKKVKQDPQGTGLFALLPKPKHAASKEANRILIPYTLTRKQEIKPKVAPVKPPQPKKNTQPAGTNALFLNYGSDDEDEPASFFSFGEQKTNESKTESQLPESTSSISQTIASTTIKDKINTFTAQQAAVTTTRTDNIGTYTTGQPSTSVPAASQVDKPLGFSHTKSDHNKLLYTATSSEMDVAANKPLSFKSMTTSTDRAGAPLDFGVNSGGVSSSSQGYQNVDNMYYNQQYEQDNQAFQEYNQQYAYGGDSTQQYGYYDASQDQIAPDTTSQDFAQDEGFRRLQGKKGRKEDVQIIDIQEDRQDYSSKEWLNKYNSEEKEFRSQLRKEQLPTSQQRRKHHITYLAHQAKERELELKNSWAENRLTRKQTQAKYGF
ncbi:proline-rich protein PRCC-like [Glandiceps talaboti]